MSSTLDQAGSEREEDGDRGPPNPEVHRNNNEETTTRRRVRKSAGLRFRSVSSGYWVAFLLPAALYFAHVGNQKQSRTAVYIILFNAIMLSSLRFLEVNVSMLMPRLRIVNLVLSGVALFVCLFNRGNLYEVTSYVALNFTFPYVFYNLIRQHPKSFSFGEGVLVTSAFSYMFWQSSQSLPFPPTDDPIHSQQEAITITLFLQLLFFGTILGARILLLLQKPWRLFILEEMLCLWSKYCTIAFFLRIPMQNDEVASFLLMWPIHFLFANETRVRLVAFWAALSLFTVVYLIWKNRDSNHHTTTTIDRKFFHFAIAFVFLPGIFWNFNLLYCCSAVVFFIFLLIETVRLLQLEVLGFKVGELIDKNVSGFRDKQDEGLLLLTPIYLLVGCALPIWLTGLKPYPTKMQEIEYAACLSGILSIGIGDTFASIGGTYYGRTHWGDSRKTVEGTTCAILAQVVAIFLIFLSGLIPYNLVSVTGLAVAGVINGIVEGNTDQIDNLVLPLVTFTSVHLFGGIFG